MRYIEFIARVAAHDAEPAADVMRATLHADVWIQAPFIQRDLESDAEIDATADVVVHAYVPVGPDALVAVESLRVAFLVAGIDVTLSRAEVAEEDWAESWKAYFNVERYGERLVVVPSWRTFSPGPGDVVIALDPGMAFGTGQHETTRMCLEAIERSMRAGMAVLDAGCGSGILSLAAAKLGAREVIAVDIDPVCVRVTLENARLSGVDTVLHARCGSLGSAWPFGDLPSHRFDLVVANIIARVIIEHAQALVDALADDGRLIVSGIIGERESETIDALRACGAQVVSRRAMGDWRCIEAVRR